MAFHLLRAALLVGLSAPAAAQSLITQDGPSGDFYSINIEDGTAAFIGGPSMFLHVWNGLASNSQGEMFTVGLNLQSPFLAKIYQVDPATALLTFVTDMYPPGISAIAFGPGDVLYAAANLTYPANGFYTLFALDLASGTSTQIGLAGGTGMDGIVAMDFDGADMYVYDGDNGISTIDLSTGLTSDVNLGFEGTYALYKAMCFSEQGVLYLQDFALWVGEPSTGVYSLVNENLSVIVGEMEYIPGPNQTIALWQTEQVGNATEILLRGATPHSQVAFFRSSGPDGTAFVPPGHPCSGVQLDLNPSFIRLAATAIADAQGNISLGPLVLPPGAFGSMRLQALDLATCITSNKIRAVF